MIYGIPQRIAQEEHSLPGACECGGPCAKFDPCSLILNVQNVILAGIGILLTITGGYCIHPNAVRGPLCSQAFREVGHSAFRRIVEDLRQGFVRRGLINDLRAHRRCDNDRTTMFFLHPKPAASSYALRLLKTIQNLLTLPQT